MLNSDNFIFPVFQKKWADNRHKWAEKHDFPRLFLFACFRIFWNNDFGLHNISTYVTSVFDFASLRISRIACDCSRVENVFRIIQSFSAGALVPVVFGVGFPIAAVNVGMRKCWYGFGAYLISANCTAKGFNARFSFGRLFCYRSRIFGMLCDVGFISTGDANMPM